MDNSRNRARSASAWRVQPPFSPVAVGRQVATQARRILSQKYGPDQKEHANRPAKSAGGRLPWIGANDSMPRAESTAPPEPTEPSRARGRNVLCRALPQPKEKSQCCKTSENAESRI